MQIRPFLIVCRAGDCSLHKEWLTPDGERNFDLIIDYYGNDLGRYAADCEYYFEAKGPKWSRVSSLLMEQQEIVSRYEAVWIPDDDLSVNCTQVNRMFQIFRDYKLDLGQPALTSDSFFSHKITIQQPRTILRMTNFVEIMAPIFSREALEICRPTFDANYTGWGLDFVWPQLLKGRKVGIIDATPVRHTRPVGGGEIYKNGGVDPNEEMAKVTHEYDIQMPYKMKNYRTVRKPFLKQVFHQ